MLLQIPQNADYLMRAKRRCNRVLGKNKVERTDELDNYLLPNALVTDSCWDSTKVMEGSKTGRNKSDPKPVIVCCTKTYRHL